MKISIGEARVKDTRVPLNQAPKKLPLGLHTGSLLQLKEGHLVSVLSPPWLLQE